MLRRFALGAVLLLSAVACNDSIAPPPVEAVAVVTLEPVTGRMTEVDAPTAATLLDTFRNTSVACLGNLVIRQVPTGDASGPTTLAVPANDGPVLNCPLPDPADCPPFIFKNGQLCVLFGTGCKGTLPICAYKCPPPSKGYPL
ncbi:MAG: hypothetical protein JNJ98_07890 [Gemmatimonadetes bacterium]|nr:hypothetical protein [Gemmatimonadota bacterium]